MSRSTWMWPAILLAGVNQAPAQEPVKADVPAEVEALKVALGRLQEEVSYTLAVTVSEQEPAVAAGGGIAMIVGAGAGDGAPFEGDLDVWKPAVGELVLASVAPLPGLEMRVDGDVVLTRTTVADVPLSAARIRSDLLTLLDFERLTDRLGRTSLDVESDAQTGEFRIAGELPAKLIRSGDGSPMAFMQPSVLRIEAVFVLAEDHSLRSMKFTVVRNDPTAAMRRMAMEQGGGNIRLNSAPQASDEEGTISVYEVRVQNGPPSVRAKAFRKQAQEIADQAEH